MPATQDTLSAFLGSEAAQSTQLEPILGGASSASLYQFSHEGQSYVLRLLAPNSSRARHHHEVGLTSAAGNLGVGPRVHFVAADESAIIYDYTPGRTLCSDDVCAAPIIERFARLLSQLDRAKVDVPAAVSPFERFRRFRQRATEDGVPLPESMTRAIQYMTQLEQNLPPTIARPCHLDLHAQNIILTPAGHFVLIDWVNGGLCDPAFDIAIPIAFLGLRDEQRDHFTATYQESVGEDLDLGRVEMLMPVRPFAAAAGSLCNTPLDMSPSQLEQEMAADDLCDEGLFWVPHMARPDWPQWKWGLFLLRMGLSYLP